MDDNSKMDFGDTQQSYDSGITLSSDYESRDMINNGYIVSCYFFQRREDYFFQPDYRFV